MLEMDWGENACDCASEGAEMPEKQKRGLW